MEYHGFENLPGCREFRLTAYGPEGPADFRFQVALAAFSDGRIRLQDGPDICYQRLIQILLPGESTPAAPVIIDDADLVSYREAHTVPTRRRPTTVASPPPADRPHQLRTPARPPRSAPPEATRVPEPTLGAGQRVCHAVFGAGVTVETSATRTTVHFDESGPRTFVSNLVELEVLSPPHTWETDRRGHNRPSVARPGTP